MQTEPTAIPSYAGTIIVPLANPATAPSLLQLATALLDPQEGRIIALSVSLGDAEAEARAVKDLQPLVEAAGERVELVTVAATSIARGILDTVREMRADLLIIGVRQPVHGHVELGTVAENVATTAPCDVLIYRAGHKSEFSRVVVWANGSQPAQIACQIGVMLGNRTQSAIEGMYVQSSGRPYWQGLARVDQSLTGIPGAYSVKRTVITAGNLVEGLLSRISDDDMLVVGFARRSELEKWLFGDFVQNLLNRTPGPVILAARVARENRLAKDLRYTLSWIKPTLTRVEQQDIVRQSQELAAPTLDYVVLIIISAMLATLGLLLNSAAVIIGAMLVAPLMQPISALSVGMTTGRLPLMRQAIVTLLMGVGAALAVSYLSGKLVPLNTPSSEMLARGSPSLLDAGVALASGLVGAYATARKGIPAALAGVAIAAALMPPVCTVGLGLALGRTELATGALLLFSVNIVYISFAGWMVFFWLGMRPLQSETSNMRRYVSLVVVLLALLLVALELRSLRNQAVDTVTIERSLETWFAPAEVMSVEIDDNASPTRIIAVLRTQYQPSRLRISRAQEALREDLQAEVNLQIIVQQLLAP